MMRRPIFFTLALILITQSFGAQTLSATTDPLTFASFSQQQFNQQTFHLANNGVIGVNKGVTFKSTLAVDEFPSSVACCSSTSLGADLLLNAHVPPLEPPGCSRTPSHPNSSSRIRRILRVTSPEHNSAARLETWPLARIPTRSGTGDDS